MIPLQFRSDFQSDQRREGEAIYKFAGLFRRSYAQVPEGNRSHGCGLSESVAFHPDGEPSETR